MEPLDLGAQFEREIREQPTAWARLAQTDNALQLARALDGDVLLVGSGSSLFAANLGALALRRRGIRAESLAATEACLDHRAYENRIVVAISQSGRSTDVLNALDVLHPRRLVALTNTADSPLGARSDLAIDVGAGPEIAVPATKSVSCTYAILLWSASLLASDSHRNPSALQSVAKTVGHWLKHTAADEVCEPGRRIALRNNVAILGNGYGLAVAQEAALKLKEAAYIHAEGFSAGEFRHGSIAMLDPSYAVIGIVDEDSYADVSNPVRTAEKSEALRYSIGDRAIDGVTRLGPIVDATYDTLAWLVTVQMIALYAARARRIDSDSPRGLTKAIVTK
jgi:glucosamine--fructose-6-phosphate aminotransferase (isomerizing)